MSIEQETNNVQEKIITNKPIKEVTPVEVINEEDKQAKIELKAQKEKENNEQIEIVKKELIKQFEIENREIKKESKLGVEFVFKQNPELISIGSKEQYSEYLDTVFPDSKVKDIVYHGSNYKIDKFEKRTNSQNTYKNDSYKAGWFFSNSIDTAKAYIDNKYAIKIAKFLGLSKDKNPTIHASLLNIQNPVTENRNGQRGVGFNEVNNTYDNNNDAYIAKNVVDPYIVSDVFVVFEPDQIHILGSKQDIEKFKEYVSESKSEQVTA